MQVAPRSVLITGANRGLGLEFVRQLLALPTPPKHLFATCRNPDTAKDLQEIAKSNSAVKVLKFDVNDLGMLPGICDAVAKEVEGEGLNMLINNAGINPRSSLDTLTEEALMDSLKVNSVSPILTTKAFLPLLKKAAGRSEEGGLSWNRAMVVNMSSIMASMANNDGLGYPIWYDYRMSKTALNMGTSCLSVELTPVGVLVLAVCPGWVQTDMGGESAPTTKTESVSGLLTLFSAASEKHAGQLYFKGTHLEW